MNPADDPLLADLPRDADGAPVLAGIPLTHAVGRGHSGAVYAGRHPQLGKLVAVKVLARNAAPPDRFLADSRRAMALAGDHLVQVLDAGADGSRLWRVTQLVEGRSAAALLGRARAEGGKGLPEPAARAIVTAAARGLAAAHARGIVHGDVKPSNILVPDGAPARLSDLALPQPPTPGFAAPDPTLTLASDVFSMGATLYALVAGRGPFAEGGAEPSPLPPDVSPGTRDIIGRCLRRDPRERYPDAAALLADLESADAGSTLSSLRDLPPPPAPPPSRSNAPLVLGILAAVVLIAAVGAGGLWFAIREFRERERLSRLDMSLAQMRDMRAIAEEQDTQASWDRVVAGAERAGALAATAEERRTVDDAAQSARARRAWASAREAETQGDLEKAIRLAEEAGRDPLAPPALAAYRSALGEKLAEARHRAARKAEFDRLSTLARATSDASERLKTWAEAAGAADAPTDAAAAKNGLGRARLDLAIESGDEEPIRMSIDEFTESIRFDASRAEAWANRGEARGMMAADVGAFERAIADLARAIELEPGLARAREQRAGLLIELAAMDEEAGRDPLERLDAAIEDLEHVSDVRLTLAVALRKKAAALGRRGGDPLPCLQRALDALSDASDAASVAERAGLHLEIALVERSDAGCERALADFDAALRMRTTAPLHAGRARTRMLQADLARSRQQDPLPLYERALADYREAIRLAPYAIDTCRDAAACAEAKGDAELASQKDATASFELAAGFLTTDQDALRRAEAYRKLGLAQEAQKRSGRASYEKAVSGLSAVLSRDRTHVLAYARRADARRLLALALRSEGKDAAGACSLAIADYDYAIPRRREERELVLGRAACRELLGEIEKEQGKDATGWYAQAVADYDDYLRGDPRHVDARRRRGKVHYRTALALDAAGNDSFPSYDKAIGDFTALIRQDAKDWDALLFRGICNDNKALALLNAGKDPTAPLRLAIADNDELVKLWPKWSTAYNNRAVAYDRLGDWDGRQGHDPSANYGRALADYDEAVRLGPADPLYWTNRGWLHWDIAELRRARGSDARAAYQKAIDDWTQSLKIRPGQTNVETALKTARERLENKK